jgi:hypothetical protein
MLKTLSIIAISFLFLSFTGNDNKDKIIKAVREEIELHPKSTLLDLYKNFFQGRFGTGHMIPSRDAALSYMNEELKEAVKFDTVLFQPVGYENRFYRVNLSLIKDSLISKEDLLDAFISGQDTSIHISIEEWKPEWASILKIIEELELNLPDFEKDKLFIESNLEKEIIVGHHSNIFMESYNPHYRLVPKIQVEFLMDLFMEY